MYDTSTNQGLTKEQRFALEAGITISQAYGADIPVGDKFAWMWKYGKSMVHKDDIPRLPTQMRRLHEWYSEVTKTWQQMILMKVTEKHFKGQDEVQIELEELFQLYKLDALDVSLVSAYCL